MAMQLFHFETNDEDADTVAIVWAESEAQAQETASQHMDSMVFTDGTPLRVAVVDLRALPMLLYGHFTLADDLIRKSR